MPGRYEAEQKENFKNKKTRLCKGNKTGETATILKLDNFVVSPNAKIQFCFDIFNYASKALLFLPDIMGKLWH